MSLRFLSLVLAAVSLLPAAAAAQSSSSPTLPAAPILLHWPEPAFGAARQCQGRYAVEDLARYLPRARVGLRLPGTRAVRLDEARRCIDVTVDDIGSARLIELLLRGVSVPRGAVLLRLREQPVS